MLAGNHGRAKGSRYISLLLLLVLCATLVALYWNVRYGGRQMDGDAVRLGLPAEGMVLEGRLVTTHRAYYSGYAYSVTLAFLSSLTDLPVPALQLNAVFWLPVFALTSFVAYRALLGESPAALLAALLLLVQPDLLFYVLRSSHEKMTWFLALLLLYLLARSFSSALGIMQRAAYIGLFYGLFWAMVATNAFFGASFLAPIAISLLLGRALSAVLRLFREQELLRAVDWRRLFLISAACFIIVYLFITYVYKPAYYYYFEIPRALGRVNALVLGGEVVNPSYEYVESTWRTPGLYLLLTSVQWVIALCSGAAWLLWAGRMWRQKGLAFDQSEWLPWLLYAGFVLQLLLGLVVALSGYIPNLYVRLFTPVVLLASPLSASLIVSAYRRAAPRTRRFAVPALAVIGGLALGASLLKASNDPLVSNLWLFYSPAELSAAQWTDAHVERSYIWMDTFPHLLDVLEFWKGYEWTTTNTYVTGSPGLDESRYVYALISQLTRLQANRSGLILPGVLSRDRIYDSGEASLYHRRPQTPYQR